MTRSAIRDQRGIVAAACRLGGLTISMPAPARHHDVLRELDGFGLDTVGADQGFLDHRGVFLSRHAARIMAFDFGQIDRERFETGPSELYSEDLW
jgi:hypothetical protein